MAGDEKRRGERSRTDGKVKNKMNRLLLENHMGARSSDAQAAMEMTDINSVGEMETVYEPYVPSLKTMSLQKRKRKEKLQTFLSSHLKLLWFISVLSVLSLSLSGIVLTHSSFIVEPLSSSYGVPFCPSGV